MDYKDFVNLWKDGNEKWQNYKFEVGSVAVRLRALFAKQLKINEKSVDKYLQLFPLSEMDEEKIRRTLYSPHACVDFIEAGWAHVGLKLLLEYSENSWPKNQFIFTISIKKKSNSWTVKIADDGQSHNLPLEFSEEDLLPIWNEFESLFRHQTIDRLDNWLKQDD